MNFFKKALVATAVVASFGATAATISSDPAQLSAEGVSIGNASAGVNIAPATFEIDFVVGSLTPAASVITLTFDEHVDLSTLDGVVGADEAVNNNIAAGTGTVAAGQIVFDYGTGSFTFDRVNVDTTEDEHTLSFEVNLGNPVAADSAFRLTFNNAAGVTVDGAATVAYASVDSLDAPIETGMGVIAEEVTQFSVALTSDFDGVTERVIQTSFVSNDEETADGTNGLATDTDTAVITVTNNEDLLAPVVVSGGQIDIQIEGQFDNGAAVAVDNTATEAFVSGAVTGVLDTTNFDDVVFADVAAPNTDGTENDIPLVFESALDTVAAATVIPVTGTMSATVTFSDGSDDFEYTLSDIGEWRLDATIINVPYFPVGFEGTSTSVHFANEVATDADIIASAIDDEGNSYGPTELTSDLAGNTVTKVSQAAIMSLFGLTESAKLSVTFNIDADNGDVNAHAYTTSAAGRTEITTSQNR